jgi:hypothetical protein
MSCGPYDDSKWRAESDARTLSEAMTIKADKERYGRALDVVKQEITAKKKLLRGHSSAAEITRTGFTKL